MVERGTEAAAVAERGAGGAPWQRRRPGAAGEGPPNPQGPGPPGPVPRAGGAGEPRPRGAGEGRGALHHPCRAAAPSD